MKGTLRILALLAILAVLALGFYRLRIEVDIFDLLPGDSLVAQGLRLYQNSFGASQDMVIAIRADQAATAQQAADALAARIAQSGLSAGAITQNPLHGHTEAQAELLAYAWFNQPPPIFQALYDRLQKTPLQQRLEAIKTRMATSYQPEEIARLGYDPLGLTSLPDAGPAMLSSRRNPFASPSGKFRIILVHPPFQGGGFWNYRTWTAQLQALVDAWRARPRWDGVVVHLTGTPAFIAQTGSGLMKDMGGSAAGTLLLVAALFWLVHRRWRPLLWLALLLVVILAATISLGGLLMGSVHAVSLGFAAILLGLAADYGLILYQEYLADPGRPLRDYRRTVAPSIAWAAATTAAAFLIIGRSSLPGMRQLGFLVGGGIVLAALTMLHFYLWPLVDGSPAVGPPAAEQAGAGRGGGRRWAITAWTVTIVLAVLAGTTLAFRRPAIDYSTMNLGPKVNRVRQTLEEVQREIGGTRNQGLFLVVPGVNRQQVAERLRENQRLLATAKENRVLTDFALPLGLWPHPQHQQTNRPTARRLAAGFDAIRQVVLAAGFSPQSLQLADAVFEYWQRFARQDATVVPDRPGARWVMDQFSGEVDGHPLALGRVTAVADTGAVRLLSLARRIHDETGSYLFGWSLLSKSLMGLVRRDALRVLLPIGLVILILLAFAFRRIGEILLSIAAMGFAVLCLSALMTVAGWSWNLMNLMALPLLLGAGVDYSIHIQFGLRRYVGRPAPVYHTVGKAILLCGASTACGFGTLAFASNLGMASLGRVCAAGIVITTLTSVFLLPTWWRMTTRKAP